MWVYHEIGTLCHEQNTYKNTLIGFKRLLYSIGIMREMEAGTL